MAGKKYKIIAIYAAAFLFLSAVPGFAYGGSAIESPQSLEGVKEFCLDIIRQLPQALKQVWQELVLPIWQKMWDWFKDQFIKLWNWFLGILGREVEKILPEAEE